MKVRRLVQLGLLLGICAALSVAGLVHWTGQTGRPSFPSFGILAISFIGGSATCLGLALKQFIEARRTRSRPTPQTASVNLDDDYLARYSSSNRIVAVVMAGFFAVLTIVFVLRPVKVRGIVLACLLLCWCIWYSVQMLITSVRFTPDRMDVRLPLQHRFSETYKNVRRIRGKLGTVVVEFLDGKCVKLHPGLGDPEVVMAYLQAYCRESVLDQEIEL